MKIIHCGFLATNTWIGSCSVWRNGNRLGLADGGYRLAKGFDSEVERFPRVSPRKVIASDYCYNARSEVVLQFVTTVTR